jgi:hypothetical protein
VATAAAATASARLRPRAEVNVRDMVLLCSSRVGAGLLCPTAMRLLHRME